VIAVVLFLVYGTFVTVAVGVGDGPWWVFLVLFLFWLPFAKTVIRAIVARRGQDLPESARQAGIPVSEGQMARPDRTSFG
jgi:ABC-type Fe3+ transport system permease subunit